MGRTACTEPQCLYSTAIPLLPLWAVRTVQNLSACTVQLYLYSPYGPYGLYRTSVPVQYSYTSTPPMCRTACTRAPFTFTFLNRDVRNAACFQVSIGVEMRSALFFDFTHRTSLVCYRRSGTTYLSNPQGPTYLRRIQSP